MDRPVRVFISSTWLDLQPERKAVEDALHRMQDTAFAGMEYFGSRPDTPREVSLAEVDRSDIYVGVFAHRYGSGITEAEYRRAKERNIPCLIYLKDAKVPVIPAHVERDPDKTDRLEAFKRELKQNHTVSFFRSPDHLATRVVADLHNRLGSAPLAGDKVSLQEFHRRSKQAEPIEKFVQGWLGNPERFYERTEKGWHIEVPDEPNDAIQSFPDQEIRDLSLDFLANTGAYLSRWLMYKGDVKSNRRTNHDRMLIEYYKRGSELGHQIRAAIERYVTYGAQQKEPKPRGRRKMIKILFLAANPTDTGRLRLDEEIRAIDQALRQTEFRDQFDIRQHWAVRITDLQSHLLRHNPDIVHFSGHGSKASEIILEDSVGNSHPVSARALSGLFAVLKDNIRCVVLNACYSEPQAQAIAEHIDCVIGMSKAIGDRAAISFAAAFYQALGYGRDIKTAFDLGCLQIDLENLSEQDTPKLLTRKGNCSQVSFANREDHPPAAPQPQQTTESKYNIQITGPVQGLVVSDAADVTMNFGREPSADSS